MEQSVGDAEGMDGANDCIGVLATVIPAARDTATSTVTDAATKVLFAWITRVRRG